MNQSLTVILRLVKEDKLSYEDAIRIINDLKIGWTYTTSVGTTGLWGSGTLQPTPMVGYYNASQELVPSLTVPTGGTNVSV